MTTIPIKPSLAEFRELAKQGNLVPVCTELIADAETPVSAFQKLDDGGYAFLLESVEKSDQAGRYSFVGSKPRITFESRGRQIRIRENGQLRQFETERDPLHELEAVMAQYRFVPSPAAGESRFSGGAVGYLSYDMVRFFEPTIAPPPKDELGLPEMFFLIAESVLIFDHRTRRVRIVSNAFIDGDQIDEAYAAATATIQGIAAQLDQPTQMPGLFVDRQVPPLTPSCNTTREEYTQMVRDGLEFIRAGDVFQFVPSQRFETEYSGDPLALYRALRFVNPSPYMFCLKFGGTSATDSHFALVGSSPEVHVRAMNGHVEIRPIAGTKLRGATEAEDEANATALLADPKERAEHLMLVDLARNDVGRIANFGTVRVTDFFTIERYSHVMHIVSNVVGDLRPDKTAYDVMRATFPAGTVSGSPKVRAMQVINGLEKSKRGIYAGAVGYFGFDGNHDSCIALRTVVLKDGKAFVQAGAGVVADSSPDSEHQECVNKAMGMMAAISRAKADSAQSATKA